MWQPVLNQNPSKNGLVTEGFDWNTEYEFRRGLDGETRVYRMVDQPGWFNIAGLWFRPVQVDSGLTRVGGAD